MNKYLIDKNELLSFLRYKILYKWKKSIELNPKNKNFGFYLLNETSYQPNSDFIQSLCKTEEERKDPIKMQIYDDILPADVARYEITALYKSYKEM